MKFARFFGRKQKKTGAASTATATQETLQKLGETEDVLLKKQEYLEKRIETELLTAKQNSSRNRRMALHALRRKRQCEKQLAQLDSALNMLQHQKNTLENASVNAEVLQTLRNSAKALKLAHNNMSVDQVQDLLEDMAEQQDVANEIAQVISNPTGLQLDDEEDLLAELDRLEEEDLENQLLNVQAAPINTSKLPVIPTTQLSTTKLKTEEDELAQLKTWANS